MTNIESKWTSVSSCMPKEYEDVLVFAHGFSSCMHVAALDEHGEWSSSTGDVWPMFREPTHWMPLPAPPSDETSPQNVD